MQSIPAFMTEHRGRLAMPLTRGTIRTHFYGHTWIQCFQLLVFGGIGGVNLILGTLVWLGLMLDAHGERRTEAGPYMVIGGAIMAAIGGVAAFDIVARRKPLIACFREGIICRVIGASEINGSPVPPMLKIACGIFTGSAFRVKLLPILWENFLGSELQGMPMAYSVVVRIQLGDNYLPLSYTQTELFDSPQVVVASLNEIASQPQLREYLQNWELQ